MNYHLFMNCNVYVNIFPYILVIVNYIYLQTGNFLFPAADACANFICQNGGTCQAFAAQARVSVAYAICHCIPQYSGNNCEIPVLTTPPLRAPGTPALATTGNVVVPKATVMTVSTPVPLTPAPPTNATANVTTSPTPSMLTSSNFTTLVPAPTLPTNTTNNATSVSGTAIR